MPITLNHSNISVQYSTGSNYIIETVKSDLYLRNENVDTVIRNNIQTASVTPATYVDSSGNVYAVESYTYSGTANTADYTRVFTKNTTCDILVVGGGGGGGFAGSNARAGGGGGAGQFLLKTSYSFDAGTYNIKVGKGGLGGTATTENGETGKNSSITTLNNTILLESSGGGGGARGKSGTISNGLNGASGGGGCGSEAANTGTGGTALIQFVNNDSVYTGYNGASGGPVFNGGGGGGYTSTGFSATTTNGGDGGSGITNNITGIVMNYCAGGGGGAYNNGVTTGTRGGNGGNITAGNGGNFPGANGGNATNGSGSGGGGAGVSDVGGPAYVGGNGGSGIVIIKYLLGTISTTNFLTNEPTVSSPTFTETIQSFIHSGGTEAQTSYDITIPQNTICDILMIGGGGAGGANRAGGGGAGALILSIGNILSGKYNIRVGNKGVGYSSTSYNGVNGYDSEIFKSDGTIIFRAKGGGGGGGIGGGDSVTANNGGSGGGARSQNGGLGGIAVSTNVVNGITTGPVITTTYGVYGNIGGRNITPHTGTQDDMDGAGGGGIGQGGSTSGSLVQVDSQFVVNNGGKGGDGLYFATINGTTYNFKNYFNVNGVQDGTTGNFFIGGGGGGGDNAGGVAGIGGKGGGGNGGENGSVGNSATGYGSGGGGAGGGSGTISGGNGSAGIIVIKFRTIVNAAISEGTPDTTRKTLYFVYNPITILPNNTIDMTSYKGVFNTTFVITITGVGNTSGNLWGTDIYTDDSQIAKAAVHAGVILNGETKTLYIKMITGLQSYTGTTRNGVVSASFAAWTGSYIFIQPFTNTYTLNFPVRTLTDINNNSNIVLNGAYDISLSSSNTSIIPKANQYIPYPTTFSTSNISLRYHLLNPVLDPIGAQWTYSSNNTNVYHMGSVGIGTTSPEYHLDVRGTIFSLTGGYTQSGLTTWSITSDRRIKENIVKASYDKCLENVKNIELYNFNFKDNYVNTNDRRQLGFIAQEVQQVYPKAVEVSKMILNLEEKIDDLLTLNTTQIDYTLYGAVKGLIHKMENIKTKMEQIKGTSNITTQA